MYTNWKQSSVDISWSISTKRTIEYLEQAAKPAPSIIKPAPNIINCVSRPTSCKFRVEGSKCLAKEVHMPLANRNSILTVHTVTFQFFRDVGMPA